MRESRKLVVACIAVAAFVSMCGDLSSAAALDAHLAPPTTMAGMTTCPVDAKLSFSSPLTTTPTTGSTTVTFDATALKGCTNRFQGNVRLVRGYLRSLTGSLAAGTSCIDFLSGLTAPELSGGTVKWTPPSMIAGSTTISFPVGSLTASTTELHLDYSGGTVSGSYSSTSALIDATSNADLATLTNLCNTNLYYIGFTGSISL